MSFFKLTLAYDGAEFSGWQRQPDRRTVEGEFERAWLAITGEAVRFNAAGRTDAGVHAAGQTASVESATALAPDTLMHALNAHLPPDAAVRSVERMPGEFHATYDAKSKRYRYAIYNDPRRPVLHRRAAWHVPTPLDAEAMHRAAQALVGTHDFASFQSTGSARESTVRTVFAVDVKRAAAGQGGDTAAPGSAGGRVSAETSDGRLPAEPEAFDEADSLLFVEVEGDGFLYNMVRTIVGTLIVVGRGKRPVEWPAEVLAACDRTAAGETAPAHGLTLLWVRY